MLYTDEQYTDMFRWADDMVRTFEPERSLAPVISIEVLRERRAGQHGTEAA